MEPIILVTEANIWCVKITVNAKWVMTRILTMTPCEKIGFLKGSIFKKKGL